MDRPARTHATAALPARLSPRRLEVLELVARGLTNDGIASALGISPGTVRIHVTHVLAALDVANRTEAAAAYFAWKAQSSSAEVLGRPAIAVLPFEALGGCEAQRCVAAAVTDDLTALFARWVWFPVIAATSARTERPPRATAQAFGRSLGARFLVTGAVRADRQAWRLTVSLEDVEAGRVLWVERFAFARDALFEVQDRICEGIVATAYDVLINGLARRVAKARPPAGLDAWTLAHEGMLLHGERAAGSNVQAMARFRAALALDPELVLARFGLGLCQYDCALNQAGESAGHEGLLESAQRCIDLAPHAAEGYFLLGRHHQASGRHAQAVVPLEQAVARNPSAASAQALLAQLLVITGRPDEGLQRMNHALRLAPRSFVAGLAAFHFLRADHQGALEHAERTLATHPNYAFARVLAVAGAWEQGLKARARGHADALLQLHPGFSSKRFLATFGGGLEATERIARALEAHGC
jgi:TolB-like protein/tetratricopeptide (TPR) repeat protein